jgi:predicted  nucleic acid-binding Zn-ribbon protein
MAKIFSILTLLIAVGAAYFGFESQKMVQNLQEAGDKTYKKLKATEAELKKTQDELTTTKEDLAKTKTELEEKRAALVKAEGDLKDMTAKFTEADTKLKDVEAKLTSINAELDKLFPGQGIQGIDGLKSKITELSNKNMELDTAVKELTNKVANLESQKTGLEGDVKRLEEKDAKTQVVIDKYKKNIMQKGIKGKVLAVNAGWGFCVLSVGDKNGAASNKTLIVARGGQAIGRVKITNVEATQSIADILPGTFARGAYVQPGDDVIYTGDDKVQVEEENPGSVTSPPLPTRQPN